MGTRTPATPKTLSFVDGNGTAKKAALKCESALNAINSNENNDTGGFSLQTWSWAKNKAVTGPYDYLSGIPGKNLREQFILAFNQWLHVPIEKLQTITAVVNMLHNASLLVDDVQDASELRRGFPAAHSIYGMAQTINSANYIYFCALRELLTLDNPEMIQIYSEEMLQLHRGQGMDVFWRDNLACPSESDYFEMVQNKTGGLFRMAIRLMQAESQSRVDLLRLTNMISILFQFLDDYKNLKSTTYSSSKGFADDITEGKFSFPVIHTISTSPSCAPTLTSILKQRTRDVAAKQYAIRLLDEAHAFDYTVDIMRSLAAEILQMIGDIEGGEHGDHDYNDLGGLRKLIETLRGKYF